MELAPVLVLGGLVIFVWLYLWLRQRQHVPVGGQEYVDSLSLAVRGDGVLVAREHGQLIYCNDVARGWLGLDGGEPSLEYVAEQAQPSDSFLELFAGETQASFQLGARWVEAASHRIPAGTETRTIVVMRELTAVQTNPDALDLSMTMNVINEIGETVNAGLGVEQALQALITIVRKAIASDAGEICLWNEEQQVLIPRGWVGDVDYVLALAEAGGIYRPGEGITGWIAQNRKPVLVPVKSDERVVRPKLENTVYQSYVGVPLIQTDRFIGTFELASLHAHGFGQPALALMQAIAAPIATAIYNAELYAEQVRRLNDIANLQQLAQEQRGEEDVSETYQVLGEQIARLLSADMCGVLLYDERKQMLIAERPFHGLPVQLVQTYYIPLTPDTPQHEIFFQREYWYSNELADEPMVEHLRMETLVHAAGMYNTILMPLEIGNQRIGMLQVGNKRTHGGFTPRDIQNLNILASQAAVVVQNIRLFQTEQRVDTELQGLQEITHAIGALSHEGEFYSDINARIARLMGIAMSGVLLYDEATSRLIAQIPFYGVQDPITAGYAIDIKPETAIEEIWTNEDYWYSNRVPTDPIIFQSGISDVMQTMGVSKTMLAALSAGGRRIGMIQASNKLSGEDFSDKDARLLLIFATQAAAMIENARLYREMQHRADEADSVRRVAELAGAILTGEDSFQPVLAEIGALLDSPLVWFNMLSQDTGALVTLPRHTYGMELAGPITQDVYDKEMEQSVTFTRRPFLSNDVLADRTLRSGFREFAEQMNIRRVVIVPLAVGERSLGALGVANRDERQYTETDMRLLLAVAIQIASALDRLRLHERTGQNLSRRLHELDAISRVSNELTLTIEYERILDVIRQEAAQATEAGGATVALLRPVSEWKNDEPAFARRLGEKLPTPKLTDIEIEAVKQRLEGVLVADYESSQLGTLPVGARSAIAAAIIYADEPIGVIHLYHESPNHFDQEAVTFLLTLAAKASLGYANALRYQENIERSTALRKRVEQLNQIFELGQMLQGTTDATMMLEAIAYSVQQSAGFDVVLMTLVNEDEGVLRRVAQAGLPIDQFEASKEKSMPLTHIDKLFADDFRISESYFLPLDKLAKWYTDGAELLGTAFDGKRSLYPRAKSDWHDGDMLLVPMHGAGGNLLGIMSLDRPFDNKRPERGTVEVLEIFAHQAANTIENLRLYEKTVRNAEQEARLNEVMEAITSTLDVHQIIETVARGAVRIVPFSRMTVALVDNEREGFDIIWGNAQLDGTIVTGVDRRDSLEGTVMGRTFETGQDILYHVTDSMVQSWQDLRSWHMQGEQTTLIVPLITGGLVLGAMHFGSDTQNAEGFDEYRPLLKRIANLAAVAIQTARLFNQAVNLRLFNESVVESIQQGIVVLDQQMNIVSVNEYMTLLGWDDSALYRNLFEYRPALKLLEEDVLWVMENAAPRERINQRIETASGEVIQNFYLYPLLTADATRGVVLLTEDVTTQVKLEEDIEKRANQLAMLTEVSSRITASLDMEEVINIALDEMSRIIPFDTMTLWLRDGDMMRLEGAHGIEAATTTVTDVEIEEHERFRLLVQTQQPYSVSRLEGWDVLPGEGGNLSWLGVPLIRQGNVIGLLSFSKAEPGFYDTQSEQAAYAFANQLAVTLTNAELYEEAHGRTQRLSLLNRVSLALAQSLDMENIFEIALREIADLTRAEKGRAYLLEREIKMARVVVEYPRGDFPPIDVVEMSASPILRYVSRSVQPMIIGNVLRASEEDEVVKQIAERGVKAYIALPIAVSGQALGLIEFEVFEGIRNFEPEQIDLCVIIANQAAIAVQNANLLEQTLVRTRELETLLEAAQATSFTLDLDEVFTNAARLTLQALDMDDCAILLSYPLENVLEVQIDLNRFGARENVLQPGTRLSLRQYPLRQEALNSRQVLIVRQEDPKADAAERADLERLGSHTRMLVPLVARDSSMGLMLIDLRMEGRSVTHRDIRMAQALAATAATAIENASLSTETAARVEELLVINDLSRAISSTIDIDHMIRIVRDQVPGLTDADALYLALYEAETGEIRFPIYVKHGVDQNVLPRALGDDEVSYVIRNRRLLALGGDFSLDEMRRSLRITAAEPDALTYLGVPLISGDQILGVLAVFDTTEKRPFGLNHQRILSTIASQLGAAIQNARLFAQIRNFADDLNERVQERTHELQLERDRLDVLYRITSELSSSLDMGRVLEGALDMVARAVGADDGVILLLDPASQRLFPRASLLDTAIADANGQPIAHPTERLGEWLLNNVQAVVIDDLNDMDYWDSTGVEDELQWRSALAVLLETNQDALGVMIFLSLKRKAFSEGQLRLVNAAASQVATSINNADLYNLIRDQAERLGMLLRAEQEEAEKSAAILESIADGVILADARGTVVLYNNAAERILDVPREVILGQPFVRLAAQFEEANSDWVFSIADWATNPPNYQTGEFVVERLLIAGRIVNVRLSPVFIGETLLGTVSVFRDITRDVEVDRMKSEFISNVSHELRTPMTSIKGYADLLLMGAAGHVTESQSTFLHTIKSNADRLATLVNDLLNISKLDSGDERLRLEDVDVSDVLNTVMTNLAARMHQDDKHLDVEVTVEPGLPLLRVDRDRITQVVTNVVDNAYSYTYAGGRIDVEARMRSDKTHVLISVKDSGIGIPKEFQSRVWERFVRFDQHALVMEVAGTGLGLSIARHLVEMHHGDIWFESEENKGTTFYISFPIPQLARTPLELSGDSQPVGD